MAKAMYVSGDLDHSMYFYLNEVLSARGSPTVQEISVSLMMQHPSAKRNRLSLQVAYPASGKGFNLSEFVHNYY